MGSHYLSRAPRLSIIIPTRNEELTITELLRSLSLQELISDCQIIVVDGQSQDGTANLAAAFPFVEVVVSAPGLVGQMNAGAERAHAPALWFLHADMTLPNPRTVNSILAALADPEVVGGACRFSLRGDDLCFDIIGTLVNLRARLLGRLYGDQGIFVRTAIFRKLGGFRAMKSCFDLDFILRLQREGDIRIISPKVYTSARTWHRYGKIKTTAWHVKEWLGYEWRRLRGQEQA